MTLGDEKMSAVRVPYKDGLEMMQLPSFHRIS